jgi:peptidyl-prolyl cis-trans isomerase SurA
MVYNLSHMKANFLLLRILLSCLFFFFLINPHCLDAAILLDRVVALVNKEVITWSELYRMMEGEATDDIKKLQEEERRKVFKEHEEDFLNRLIDIRLQVQEAKRLGIEVSPDDVKEAIENIKNKYVLTDEELKASLEKEGLTFDAYKERLSEQILISKLVNQQVRSKIVVSDEEVDEFYNEHKDSSVFEESYKLRQIFFKMQDNDDIRKDLEEKASDIAARIQEGEDFSRLAQEYSEDSSGKLGGDLGYIQKKFMAQEFIDALSNMKTGDCSSPFWTEQGLHIIKLEDKKSAKTEETVKEEIKTKLFEGKFIGNYESWIKDLRNGARIVIRL